MKQVVVVILSLGWFALLSFFIGVMALDPEGKDEIIQRLFGFFMLFLIASLIIPTFFGDDELEHSEEKERKGEEI